MKHIGEKFKMKNGEVATIIEYTNHKSVKIQLSSGTVLNNQKYSLLKDGKTCSHYNKSPYIGRRRQMNCGEFATIIDANGPSDLTVKFDNGLIVKHRTYANFASGRIQKDTSRKTHAGRKFYRIGEEQMMTSGEIAKIVKYLNNGNIDVQFEDGTIVQNRTYQAFKTGHIKKTTK